MATGTAEMTYRELDAMSLIERLEFNSLDRPGIYKEAADELKRLAAQVEQLEVVRSSGDRLVEVSFDGSEINVDFAGDHNPVIRINNRRITTARDLLLIAEKEGF